MKKDSYGSVLEMMEDIASPEFVGELRDRLERRDIVKQLSVYRVVRRRLSQAEVAEAMGCTQSRVSKLESGTDEGLSVWDMKQFAAALGLRVEIRFLPSTLE